MTFSAFVTQNQKGKTWKNFLSSCGKEKSWKNENFFGHTLGEWGNTAGMQIWFNIHY